ncbi:hypothetical protein QBC40DRAFT_275476 [Triangularia verruculosa]|uniref:Uncharacterized protein n=1 Tax=Triangularia verruculosa TaxID=2587418 RepID=A0AAN6XM61_9PEZI|nr:hypothetical protein QBC40DRAFT_275476 [Triangularia verruculosa]
MRSIPAVPALHFSRHRPQKKASKQDDSLGWPINEADIAPGSPLIPHWLRPLHGKEPVLHMPNPKDYRGELTKTSPRSHKRYVSASLQKRRVQLKEWQQRCGLKTPISQRTYELRCLARSCRGLAVQTEER